MPDREIDAWLTTEIHELGGNEEVLASGPGYMGTNLRLAVRARLMAETALAVAGVETKKEHHNLHKMLEQLRNSVSLDKAEHLDNHYKDAAEFYRLNAAPNSLHEYWQSTADSHIHFHMRYAPTKSAKEKAQAASRINKVSLILDVELLRALHAILNPSWPQCSMPYSQWASVRGHNIVLDQLLVVERGDQEFIDWCSAYDNLMDAFWVEPSKHPNEEAAGRLAEAMQNLKGHDDPAVLWLVLPFRQIEMWQSQIERYETRLSGASVGDDKQRWTTLIDNATEHIIAIKQSRAVQMISGEAEIQ